LTLAKDGLPILSRWQMYYLSRPAMPSTATSKRRPTSRNGISWQWEAQRTAYVDFIWSHLEQPACMPSDTTSYLLTDYKPCLLICMDSLSILW